MTIATNAVVDVSDAGLPRIDYETIDDPAAAHRMIKEVRRQSPVAIGPHAPEVLSYELVRTVLRDSRFHQPGVRGLVPRGVTGGPLWDRIGSALLSLDGDEHTRLRKLVCKAFTGKAVGRLDSLIDSILAELVDPVAAVGRCDIVADVAQPYPIPVICALFGAPRTDWRMISDWTDDIFKMFWWDVAAHEAEILTAWQKFDDYIDAMITDRRAALTDDLLSGLIRAEDDGDRLSHSELLMLSMGILAAGTDTTRNQLAAAVDTFCDHPDQWALLATHPELVPQAVDEVMRFAPIVLNVPRYVTEDVELSGFFFPRDSLVVANTAAANRDPLVYDNPDQFDITRHDVPPMLTFGGGVHYCLGSHLARLELVRALTVLTQRMPNIRRTGPAPWKPLMAVSGPQTLSVEFDAGH